VPLPKNKDSKEGPINMATVDVDIKKLLESGAHFGHKTSRWHPKMAPFIHSKRNGTHIIDLTKTVEHLETALKFIESTTSEGKHDIALQLANDTKMPFVVERWLGGMLTNRATIGARVKRLQDLESKMENGQLAAKYSKLEVQRFQEEIERLNHIYGGIKNMAARPGAVFIFDITHDTNAVREARKLGIPVIALVDTNADPTDIQYPVPCNDDAIKALQLVADYVKAAIEAGATKHANRADKGADKTDKEEK
jgi:small subunit ribosomal protein S2